MTRNVTLEELLPLTQNQLMETVQDYFSEGQVREGEYLYIRGEAPVLLAAHLDTVHTERIRDLYISEDNNRWSSPQGIGGDDRCGVYALIKTWQQTRIRPSLVFTCSEETGCLGAKTFANDIAGGKFEELKNIKFIIEIDRKGSNDAVYYNCDNCRFEDYISSKGFETNYGSRSDISEIAPVLDVAAVNLSSGYYNAHRLSEYIVISELENVIERVIQIVNESDSVYIPRFSYTLR